MQMAESYGYLGNKKPGTLFIKLFDLHQVSEQLSSSLKLRIKEFT